MRDRLRLGSRVGIGALERAADNYQRALLADPRYVPAALALADVELSLLDSIRLRDARDAVRRSVAALTSPSGDLLLAWGRLERATGNLQVAAGAFERYLAGGGSHALGRLELARTRLALGQPAGDAPYYEGAALDDPETVAQYRADLAVIAADSILREFDTLRGQGRAAFLHRFWTDRDHFELRTEGERLRERYRRLVFAPAPLSFEISRRFFRSHGAFPSRNVE